MTEKIIKTKFFFLRHQEIVSSTRLIGNWKVMKFSLHPIAILNFVQQLLTPWQINHDVDLCMRN